MSQYICKAKDQMFTRDLSRQILQDSWAIFLWPQDKVCDLGIILGFVCQIVIISSQSTTYQFLGTRYNWSIALLALINSKNRASCKTQLYGTREPYNDRLYSLYSDQVSVPKVLSVRQ